MAKETQALFDMVAKADRQAVTALQVSILTLTDGLETEARAMSRQLSLVERAETDPVISGRLEEWVQTCRAMLRELGKLEDAAREVSKVEQQLHRIVGEITPAAEAAGYKVKP